MSHQVESGLTEWAKGWPIVVSSLVGIAFCLSPLPYYSLGVLAPELINEFGWDRAEVTFGFFCMTIGVFIGAPVAGYFTDRYGPRKVVLPSTIILGLTMMAFVFMDGSLWTFYLIFTLMATLSVGTLPITWTKAINNSFDKTRGIALGVALTGTGIYGFFAPTYVQWLIDGWGWKAAYIGVGALPIVFAFPLAFFLFSDKSVDKKEIVTNSNTAKSVETYGMTMAEIVRNYRFYIFLVSFFVLGAAISGILANSVLILLDKGYTPQAATSLLTGVGITGLSVLFGRALGGYLLDRFWPPGVAFVFMIVPVIACYLLMQENSSMLMNSIALAITGLAAGVEYDMMAFLTSRYFGMRSYGRTYAIVYALYGVGAGASPFVYNKVQIATGSYDLILTIAGIGFVFGAVILLFLGQQPTFDKSEKLETAE